LIEVDIKDRKLKAYDSLPEGPNIKEEEKKYHVWFERIYQWLGDWLSSDAAADKYFNIDNWVSSEEKCPLQRDCYNCGLFLCMYISCLTGRHCRNSNTTVYSWNYLYQMTTGIK